MGVKVEVKKGVYYDSVALMVITKELKKINGVKEALVGMGTELNKELAQNMGLADSKVEAATGNDFFIAVLSDNDDCFDEVTKTVDELLNKKKETKNKEYNPKTIEAAMESNSDANMVLISLPGKFAFAEAKKALNKGLNVMLFSDNVSVEQEKQLKEIGKEKELLVMGPDCGTAIINNVPLAFANVVSKGDIGIVGASGTGTQEVTQLIDKMGGGVTQVIGTGGRDLKLEIGGIMMLSGLQALIDDDATKVIVLISKPPAEEIAKQVLQKAKDGGKPVVVCFLGGNADDVNKYGLVCAKSLEDASFKAVAISKGQPVCDKPDFDMAESEIDALVKEKVSVLKPEQKYLRGLYTGGTLCDEAMKTLGADGIDVFSNIPFKPEFGLTDAYKSEKNTCIDLGDDMYTVGRAHPMIDPSYRFDRLGKEIEDKTVAVVLMDFVIGYGSHKDPVGEMLPNIKNAKNIIFVASVCGTDKDPQGLKKSENDLKEAGVIVMPSNIQAVRFVSKVLKSLKGGE